jgi:hypothetical protein
MDQETGEKCVGRRGAIIRSFHFGYVEPLAFPELHAMHYCASNVLMRTYRHTRRRHRPLVVVEVVASSSEAPCDPAGR